MSDFDKFFAERLNEETEFPRQDKNWQALSKRLDVLAVPAAAAHVAHAAWLKLATAALVFLSGILVWKVCSVENELSYLKQQISTLTNEVKRSASSPAPAAASALSDKDANIAATNSGVWGQTRWLTPPPFFPSAYYSPATTGFSPTSVAGGQDNPEQESAHPKETPNLPFLPVPRANLRNQIEDKNDTRVICLPSEPAPVIRPHRERESRFRVGVQAQTALLNPQIKGVSRPTGAGLQAEFSPVRNFWITGSMDWLSYTVQSADSLPASVFPDDYPDHKFFYKLYQIDARPRQKQISLGLQYTVPIRFWVRPSIHFSHSWVRSEPGVFTFEYRKQNFWDPTHVHIDYMAIRPENKWIHNIWRLGAALEHETPRLSFRAGVDWMESSGASSPIFDAIVIRTGVQYKF